jgi:uncharacterized protein
MKVEWDENKRISNLRDHGVDFQDAALIFLEPVIESNDARVNYGEPRHRALGHFNGGHFMVAYT